MQWISVVEARKADSIGQQAVVKGWVRTRRDSKGGFSFIEVNDGSCMANLQLIADAELSNYESDIKKLSAGCSIVAEGTVKESGGKGQNTELQVSSLKVEGWADPEEFPLQKKRHSFEKLREWAHLRPRTNTFGAVARVRNCICNSIHQFFQEDGFLYVNTPVITASDCEGAGEMFRVTTLDMENPPKSPQGVDYTQDFFDRPSYLTVSGQLEAEIYSTALGNVYTFGPTFRAENSNTSRHLAEFWMIEPEMAFYDLDDNMSLAERFLKRVFRDAMEKCPDDMQFFNDRIDDTVLPTLQSIVDSDFVRMTYTDAIEALQSSGETDTLQGRSILPLVKRQTEDWPTDMFVQISESQVGRAVRTQRWKYGVVAPDKDGWNDADSDHYVESYLYDLQADPYELTNLITVESHHEVAAMMQQRLLRRMVEVGEAAPTIESVPRRPAGQRCVSPDEITA